MSIDKTSTARAATSLAEDEDCSLSSADAIWVRASGVMRNLDQQIDRVARAQHPVLLTGESGSGKTTVAEIIHSRSQRSHDKFIDVNCSAIPDLLLESELFGFERGAFTGATTRKHGLFESANNGTLFLDEIGDLKLDLQVKLLKAIDKGRIRRLGGMSEIECNVRVVAASSRDLTLMTARGSFREDLYYRLAVLQLDVPPLRERLEDVDKLIDTQLRREQLILERSEPFEIDRAALKELRQYRWPGNVRQLQNVIARLACYAETNRITVHAVRAELKRFKHLDSDTIILPASCSTLLAGESFARFSDRVKGAAIEAVKGREGGNMKRAAQRLSVDRSSLLRMERRINITRLSTGGPEPWTLVNSKRSFTSRAATPTEVSKG